MGSQVRLGTCLVFLKQQKHLNGRYSYLYRMSKQLIRVRVGWVLDQILVIRTQSNPTSTGCNEHLLRIRYIIAPWGVWCDWRWNWSRRCFAIWLKALLKQIWTEILELLPEAVVPAFYFYYRMAVGSKGQWWQAKQTRNYIHAAKG